MKPNYFALINAMIFLLFSNNFIHGETQRKLQSDENYWKYFENYDGVWPNDLPYENYMILYYGQEVEYTFGYSNEFRKDISFIMNGDINKTETDPLNIAPALKSKYISLLLLKVLKAFLIEYMMKMWNT